MGGGGWISVGTDGFAAWIDGCSEGSEEGELERQVRSVDDSLIARA